MKQAKIKVSGTVQGVSYRMFTDQKAKEIGLHGWVRNCANGQVEILAQGTEEQIEQLAKWCWQGSPHALVDDVKCDYQELKKQFSSFSIRY